MAFAINQGNWNCLFEDQLVKKQKAGKTGFSK